MAHKLCLWGALALSVGVASCGGNDQPSPSAPAVFIPQSVDTAQVLGLASVTSETKTPFPVDGGLVTFSDTSEITAPISVNAN
jgi:hypothetical protein